MKKKIIAIITILSMLIGMLSLYYTVFAFGASIDNPCQWAELYQIELTGTETILSGRWFGDADKQITAVLSVNGAVTKTQTIVPTTSDGCFSVILASTPAAYRAEIRGEEGTAVFDLDFSGFSGLFNKNGSFTITKLTLTDNRIFLDGYHHASARKSVTMKALSANNPVEPEGVLALKQVMSDADGSFTIEFKMDPAPIQLNLLGKGLTKATYNCRLPELNCFTVNEDEYSALLAKLHDMITTLDAQAAQCAQKGITTDYEDVNREVIRKFMENIPKEIDRQSYDRLGQYNYALTKLYLDAYTAMEAYLDGSRQPLSVPEYQTGVITADGLSLTGMTDNHGTMEEAPVFFTGFCGWDNAAEEIPFFSKIGLNTIQTEIKMYDVLVEDDVNLWSVRHMGEPEIMFDTANIGASGSYSLHINNMPKTPAGSYKYVFQDIPVKPNTTYQFGLKGKGNIYEDKAIHINLNGLTGAGRKYFQTSNDWVSYNFEYKTASDQTEVRMVILAEGGDGAGSKADYYIDDVYMQEKGTTANILANPGFERQRTMTALDAEAAELGLYIDYERLNWIEDVLATAAEHGVMVDLGIGPYYLPYFIRDIEGVEDGGRGFTNYSLTNETVRKVTSLWSRLIVDTVDEYDSLKSLCLMGEPEVHANLTNHYDEDWTAFLKERYNNSISALNSMYGTSYTSFSQVEMPRDYKADGTIGNDVYKIYSTAVYYDYIAFNDGLLADFVKWYAEEIKTENQDIFLHVKFMEYFRNDYRRYHNQGTNWENLSRYLDVNGCDAHSYYEYPDNTPMTLKMANYDFMTSVKNAPVWDSESHIIDDPGMETENGEKTPMYSDKITRYIGAEIWNGAVHGGTTRQYWHWDWHNMSMPWGSRNHQNANFTMRPEELAVMGRASKDLMRLSKEVSALQNAERKTAILYSRTNASYSGNEKINPYMQSIQAAYEELIASGQRVGFVTDSAPADMHNYDLLVIPKVTHVSAEMLNEIKAYQENGGTVILTGGEWKWSLSSWSNEYSLLKYDEYDKAQDRTTWKSIINNAKVDVDISDTVDAMGISEVELIDTATGKYPVGVEWIYTKQGDNYLVNIMNYDEDMPVNIKVYLKGMEVTTSKELRSGQTVTNVTANPMIPILLSFGDNTFELVDSTGNVIQSNLTELKSGTIRCNLPVSDTMILAVYKDDMLMNVALRKNTITFTPNGAGKYRLVAMDWNLETMEPLRESKTIRMEVIE
ncbi:MAG: beta-galactosidase trimerization domain-containing protein [Clostridia bacterium]|nr:beta-galactosidase trimerization domain-containing protein [Clostridia bacterium]